MTNKEIKCKRCDKRERIIRKLYTELEASRKLWVDIVKEAVDEERERCASVALRFRFSGTDTFQKEIAQAIRQGDK